jgi:hypothetical protein
MASKFRYLYYILLIISPVPVLLLGVAGYALSGKEVADIPFGTILADASKIVFLAF